MSHPPGTIGIISGDLTRWAWFQQSVLGLAMPPGTTFVWVTGLWVAAAVNRVLRSMQGEWCCILADDHILPPDMLMRLLDHEQPIVAPLCALRSPPYAPSLFHEREGQYLGYQWTELAGKSGLMPCDAYGGPGVVLRREVIETLGDPWFQCMPGKLETPHEDLWFFTRAKASGFQPLVDLDLTIGHITPASVFPHRFASGAYGVRLWSQDDLAFLAPQAVLEAGGNAAQASREAEKPHFSTP